MYREMVKAIISHDGSHKAMADMFEDQLSDPASLTGQQGHVCQAKACDSLFFISRLLPATLSDTQDSVRLKDLPAWLSLFGFLTDLALACATSHPHTCSPKLYAEVTNLYLACVL